MANPKSPWMHVAGERLWIAHGASDRQSDYDRWKEVARYGMTKLVITDHETGWRDGGESFTLPHPGGPGKGGDAGQADYARKIHALGFRYGIYNNYTDFAPVNEYWNEDYVTRVCRRQVAHGLAAVLQPQGRPGVELEARLAPIIQEKFHLDTAYCDVHTCVPCGGTPTSTPVCSAPARSPPPSTPTARSCSTRRRPGTARSIAKATTTGITAA